MWIRSLSSSESVALLAANRLGHIACAKNDMPYVVPIYFAYADNHIYGFSVQGKKIEFMRANPKVSLLVEQRGHGREWQSVIVDGSFEELPDRIGHKRERDHARSLLSKYEDWWEPGALKPIPTSSSHPYVFFRIRIENISGREARNESSVL